MLKRILADTDNLFDAYEDEYDDAYVGADDPDSADELTMKRGGSRWLKTADAGGSKETTDQKYHQQRQT